MLYDVNEINSFTYIIFEHLLNYSKIDLILNKDQKTSSETDLYIAEIIYRLRNEEPIQYIIGKTNFCDLDFVTQPGVLIPRPETEELVVMIIKAVQKKEISAENILDIGTGSGCIAVSLKKYLPESRVQALDISEKALKIARNNASLNMTDVEFLKADILNHDKVAVSEKFDLIVSNPPYVTIEDKEKMSRNVLDYEPASALFFQGNNPLVFYEAIADFSAKHLKDNGNLFLEINEKFGRETAGMLKQKLSGKVEILKDLSGKDRFVVVKYNQH